MSLKIINPTTPSQRNLIKLKKNHLAKSPLLKSHVLGLKNSSGRNNSGKITVYHKGGGHKKKYRKINFLRNTVSLGIVITIEYDPNRTANIASVYNILENNYYYILAPKNLTIGDIVRSGPNAQIKIGHSLPLSKIPVGSLIHAISTKKNRKSTISRAAGTFSQLIEKNSKYARIKVSSKKQKFISIHCYATIGTVSNELLFLTNIGKAGRARWLNKRPTVRGVAMNPVDHPHGGGEGKKSGSLQTPWGKPKKRKKNK